METKLNIAEILRDKPQGTKLYSLTYGDCSYQEYTGDFGIECQSPNGVQFNLDEYGRYYIDGECILFPSKSMRDWSKFAWKKGDVLMSKGRRTLHVIFEEFNDDTYTTFKGKHFICDYSNKENCDDEKYYNDYHKEVEERTIEFEKDNVNNAQTYINIIEKRLGGKLNRETLEIEKQFKFKNGDIVIQGVLEGVNVYIIKNCIDKIDNKYNYYARYNIQNKKIIYDDWSHISPFAKFATDSEKQLLFDAIAKENKAWDAEKKEVVDLKPKVVFKPFDKVLVRDCLDEMWRPSFFAGYLPFGREPYQVISGEWVKLCIPYEGNESLLGTTKDVED